MFGDTKTWTPAVAALLNGALGHSLDFDDTHADSSLHPSAPVVPAAFAVGEMTGASGRDVLTAIVAGYEVCCRLGNALDPTSHYARGFHPTATAGTYGAAAAAGKLFGLTQGPDHLRLRRLRQPGRGLAAIPGQWLLEQALSGRRRRDERRDCRDARAQRIHRLDGSGRGQARPARRLQRQSASGQGGRRPRQDLRDHEDRRQALSELPLYARGAGCADRHAARAQSDA